MPKEVYELKLFNEGIISHPDPEDLNINAATYSKNLDSHAPAGLLGPRQKRVMARTFDFPITTSYILLDQQVGVHADNAEYIYCFFSPAQGVNGEITHQAKVGFIPDFYSSLDIPEDDI